MKLLVKNLSVMLTTFWSLSTGLYTLHPCFLSRTVYIELGSKKLSAVFTYKLQVLLGATGRLRLMVLSAMFGQTNLIYETAVST